MFIVVKKKHIIYSTYTNERSDIHYPITVAFTTRAATYRWLICSESGVCLHFVAKGASLEVRPFKGIGDRRSRKQLSRNNPSSPSYAGQLGETWLMAIPWHVGMYSKWVYTQNWYTLKMGIHAKYQYQLGKSPIYQYIQVATVILC